MEYATELAPDVPESMSTGAITGLVAVLTFVQITVVSYFYDPDNVVEEKRVVQ
jgi:hypothetical protein